MKLLLCLVALVAFASCARKITVQHKEHSALNDMDRMSYDGILAIEQADPAALNERVHNDDVTALLKNSLGPNWADHVEFDDSENLTYLEFVRLSTSINLLKEQLEKEERHTRGFEEGHEEGHEEGDARANMCMCHGTFHSNFTGAVGMVSTPYRGVRVLSKAGTYYGNNPYVRGVPQDCLLCEGEVNCKACCHGSCTIGSSADYEFAVSQMVDESDSDWPLGLYPCPDYEVSSTDDTEINDISACTFEITDCAGAVDLCSCSQKRHLMQQLGCTCMEVMVLCDSCFEAWDAIDKYKHCDCIDYARHYQTDRS